MFNCWCIAFLRPIQIIQILFLSIMFQYYLLKIGGPVTHNWCPKLPNLGGYVLLLLPLELLTFRHFTEESLKNVKIDGLTGRETSHLFFWHFFSWCGKPENNNLTLKVAFLQKVVMHFSYSQIYLWTKLISWTWNFEFYFSDF